MERYSFSGKGRVLIKAAVAGTYGGKDYVKDEPIAYFTEVMVNVNFAYIEKVPRQGIDNLTVDSKSSLSYLTLTNIQITDSLQSLLYKKQSSQTKNKTIVKKLVSENNSLFLPIGSDEVLTGNLFIYDEKTRVTSFTLDAATGEITGLNDGLYTIFYSINKNAISTFFLDAPTMPNLAAEIQVDGNVNGKTGEGVIHLNKLRLLSRPSLDFTSNKPFVDSLEFAILIDDKAEVNYYG